MYGRKADHLSSELSMAYRDEGTHTYAIIYDSYDIKDIEASRFLEEL